MMGGIAASLLRLPPLIGFLGAGFAVSAVGLEEIPFIEVIGELGVTTLLFTIGLQLSPREIAGLRVVGSAAGHAVANTLIFAALFGLAGLMPLVPISVLEPKALAYVGIAASFSSTVFVMAQLAEHNRSSSAIGRIAIGVLVLQDIMAVGVLVFSTGKTPHAWALLLPLLLLLRSLVTRMPDRMFRTEMLVITGISIAVSAYSLFELAGVSGSLGSFIAGIVLSGHPIAERFYDALMSVRELLLVAFFLEIGLGGLPDERGFVIAGVLLLFLVAKAAIFMVILFKVGMSARTSALSGVTLANYSEFGLIITSVAVGNGVLDPNWTSVMAIAVAGSFVLGAVCSAQEQRILPHLVRLFPDRPVERLAPDERPVQVTDADALVLGMGRVGEGVYHRLKEEYGLNVYGIEFDEDRIAALRLGGHQIIAGDVTDMELWRKIEFDSPPRMIVVALPLHHAAVKVLRRIRDHNTRAIIASTTQIRAHNEALLEAGADVTVYLYDGAGEELADQAVQALMRQKGC